MDTTTNNSSSTTNGTTKGVKPTKSFINKLFSRKKDHSDDSSNNNSNGNSSLNRSPNSTLNSSSSAILSDHYSPRSNALARSSTSLIHNNSYSPSNSLTGGSFLSSSYSPRNKLTLSSSDLPYFNPNEDMNTGTTPTDLRHSFAFEPAPPKARSPPTVLYNDAFTVVHFSNNKDNSTKDQSKDHNSKDSNASISPRKSNETKENKHTFKKKVLTMNKHILTNSTAAIAEIFHIDGTNSSPPPVTAAAIIALTTTAGAAAVSSSSLTSSLTINDDDNDPAVAYKKELYKNTTTTDTTSTPNIIKPKPRRDISQRQTKSANNSLKRHGGGPKLPHHAGAVRQRAVTQAVCSLQPKSTPVRILSSFT